MPSRGSQAWAGRTGIHVRFKTWRPEAMPLKELLTSQGEAPPCGHALPPTPHRVSPEPRSAPTPCLPHPGKYTSPSGHMTHHQATVPWEDLQVCSYLPMSCLHFRSQKPTAQVSWTNSSFVLGSRKILNKTILLSRIFLSRTYNDPSKQGECDLGVKCTS